MILPPQDGKDFFEIALPLLAWVKKRSKRAKETLRKGHNKKRSEAEEAHILWNAIWERPNLLNQYLAQSGGVLPEETKRVLSDWRNEFVSGPFIVERYLKEGAVFISIRDGRVYLVSGITSEIEESLPQDALPRQAQTALMPFKGHLIYDGTMETEPYPVGAEGVKTLNEVYQNAKQQGRIIRRLPSDVPPPDGERWASIVQKFLSPKEQENSVNLEEQLREVLSAPDVHILSEHDLAVLDKMLSKPHRSEKDWDTIKDILLDADLFTIEPPRSKKVRAVEGVLYENGTLLAFTSLQKCQAYIRKLSGEQGARRYYMNVISCETLFEIARKKK
ncbi:MAG: hypothetical protein J6X53_04205, partial [Abditibacteriota bacterium]|nr:hypothetical protein [Abditibacteriota bacterium]